MPKKVTPRGRAAAPPKGEDAGVAPPARKAVQKAASQETTLAPHPNAAKYYVRNIREIPVALRLTGTTERRIELTPRGRRGDMATVSEEELYDEILLDNIGWLIQVITASEARNVISKQYTNVQQNPGTNPLLDVLRDENDQPITKVTLEKSNTEAAITTATVDEKGNIDRSAEQPSTLTQGVGPARANVPGSQENPIPMVPDSVPPEQAADWLAGQGDPVAYIEALRQRANPTQD